MELYTPNFDSVAHAYRWMEYLSFGPLLERCRFHFLARCSNARHALLLGDGDGRFTARLLVSNPTAKVEAVDASAAMLASLRKRALRSCPAAHGRLVTTEADIRNFSPPLCDYDLVVSHFFLDCLSDSDVADLIARVSNCLGPEAIWLVSEFAVPRKGWRRLAARMLIRSLYFAFFLLTRLRVRNLPNYSRSLVNNGFLLIDKAEFLGGILTTEIWQRQSR